MMGVSGSCRAVLHIGPLLTLRMFPLQPHGITSVGLRSANPTYHSHGCSTEPKSILRIESRSTARENGYLSLLSFVMLCLRLPTGWPAGRLFHR